MTTPDPKHGPPEFDFHGYPTDRTLATIREWEAGDCAGLLNFVISAWRYPDYVSRSKDEDGDMLHLSTGGWSGNEDLIAAMEENAVWWVLHWWSSRRGGHHVFRLRGAL